MNILRHRGVLIILCAALLLCAGGGSEGARLLASGPARLKIKVIDPDSGQAVESKVFLVGPDGTQQFLADTDEHGVVEVGRSCHVGEQILARPRDKSYYQSDLVQCAASVEILVFSRDSITKLEVAGQKADREKDNGKAASSYGELEKRLRAVNSELARSYGKLAQERRHAFSLELAVAAKDNLETDPERSILLALQAASATSADKTLTPEAEKTLHEAVRRSRVRLALPGHTKPLTVLAYSPDGKYLATASDDGTVKIWDSGSGELVRTLASGEGQPIVGLAFTRDGRSLLTGSVTGSVQSWNVGSWEMRKMGSGDVLAAQSGVSFSPDGQRAAAGSGPILKLWEVTSGKATTLSEPMLIGEMVMPQSHNVTGTCFSPDGKRLASKRSNGTFAVWDLETNPAKQLLSFNGDGPGRFSLGGLAFSPDGVRLAVPGPENTARVWDLRASGRPPLATLVGHTNLVTGVVFSPDGRLLASGSPDGTARLWDSATGAPKFTLSSSRRDGVTALGFSPDGRFLATGNESGTAKVWYIGPEEEVRTLSFPNRPSSPFVLPSPTNPFVTVGLSTDGKLLAVANGVEPTSIWGIASGRQIASFANDHRKGSMASLIFSPAEDILATVGDDEGRNHFVAKLWELKSGKVLRVLPGQINPLVAVAIVFSPDGTRVATLGSDNQAGNFDPVHETLRVSDTDSGRELLALKVGNVMASRSQPWVAFDPPGGQLAIAAGYVGVWDIAKKTPLPPLPERDGGSTAVAFSPDGKLLAVVSFDGVVTVHGAGKPLPLSEPAAELLPGGDLVVRDPAKESRLTRAITFSADGKRVFGLSDDGTIRAWDVQTHKEVLNLPGDFEVVGGSQQGLKPFGGGISFSADGKRLATVTEDGVVRVFSLDVGDLMTLARGRVTRSLTGDECKEYLRLNECPPSL